MLDDMTKQEYEDLFKLTRKEVLPYEKLDNVWISVTIEMDLNLMTYERTLYTMFDLLSDVGGLSGILVTIFSVLITCWNYNSFENLLVSSLFNIKSKNLLKRGSTEEIKVSRTPNCREGLFCLLPSRCTVCCR